MLRGYYGKRNSGYATSASSRSPDPASEVEHEQVLSGVGSSASTGSIADALRAQRDPTSDRAQAVTCEQCRAQLKAWADAAKPKANQSSRGGG